MTFSVRGWLAVAGACVGLSIGASGCANAQEEDGAASSDLTEDTCGLDPASPDSPRRLLNDPMKDPADVARRFHCLRAELNLQHDGRAPFLSLYSDITDVATVAIEGGRFEDSEWVSRYLTAFAELYRSAFVGYVDGHGDEIPASWRISFDAAREDRALNVQAVALGVNAHVDRDLSHALVIVGIGDDSATREARKRDHFKVNDILHENVRATLDRFAAAYAPVLGEAPGVVMDVITEAYFRAVEAGRLKAWLDAVALTDAFPLFRPAIEGEIEVSSKLLAETILVPTFDSTVLAKLKALEAGQ